MNNVVKLQRNNVYNSITPAQAISALLNGVMLLIEFVLYAVGYFMYAVKTLLKTDTVKGLLIFYRRYVRVWAYSLVACIALVNFGSAKLGLTCVSICLPMCIVYTMLSKLPRAD